MGRFACNGRCLDILIRAEDETAVLLHLKSAGYKVLQPLSIPRYIL